MTDARDGMLSPSPPSLSFFSRVARSLTFQFLMLVAAVVVYNRIVYATGSVSSQTDFSTWAAPLRAIAIPVATHSRAILHDLVPIALAAVWIALNVRERSRVPRFASHVALAVLFAITLNITVAMMDDGVRSIAYPFTIPGDYWPDSARVVDPLQFLRDYPTMAGGIHPRTHPPGAVLSLWLARRVIGDNVMIVALISIALSALTIVPAAVLARKLYGERVARLLVALLVLTPNFVLFGATCIDGVYALLLVTTAYSFFAEGSWLVRGIRTGVLLAISTFFTFATSALILLFIIWWIANSLARRKMDRSTFAVLAIAAFTMTSSFALLYVTTGCNIVACLRASIAFDHTIMHEVRAQYWDMATTNLFGFLVGSGLIASTLWLRSAGRGNQLALSLVITVFVLSFSTLFTREVERVWLFFTPILMIGAAVELERRRRVAPSLIVLFAQTWTTQLLLYTFW